MRTAALVILLMTALVLQGVVVPRLEWGGARADVMLVLALFLALHARRPWSWWSGVVVGAACDLASMERFGLFTLTYGLTGLFVATIREYLFIYNVLIQAGTALLAGVATQAAWLVYRSWQSPAGVGGFSHEGWTLIKSALLTALLVPPAHYALLSIARWLGVPDPKYRAARWK
ncbi:MAG: rod shape-determining protein MreD [Phycisphaerales bacterium]|nr:rod shape-determining protein MreD [Phycisphaerales bacterium]